jgi:hypothetical protein
MADQIPPVPVNPTGVLNASPVRLVAAAETLVITVVGALVTAGAISKEVGGVITIIVGAVVLFLGELVRDKVWAPTTVARLAAKADAAQAEADAERSRALSAETEKQRVEAVLNAELTAARNLATGLTINELAPKLADAVLQHTQPAARTPTAQPARTPAAERGVRVGSIVRVDAEAPKFAGRVAAVIDVGEPERNDHEPTDLLLRPYGNSGGDGWVDGRWVELWPPVVHVTDRTGRAGRGPEPPAS